MIFSLRHLRTAVSAVALAAAGPAVATLVLPPALNAARAQSVSVDVAFQSELQPYGEWVTVQNYGRVWRPHGMAADWRPYTRGHWEHTSQYGWYWRSDEKWGWIAFHYGRWAFVDNGWVWIPGSVWAPAWVSWRTAGSGKPDYIGWAPLPPPGVTIETYQREPRYWTFVRPAEIVAPDISRVVVTRTEYPTIIQRTTIVDRTVVVDGGGFNRGIGADRIRVAVGHPIKTVTVQPRRFDVQVAVREHHLDPAVARAFEQRHDREVARIRDEGFVAKSRQEAEQRNGPVDLNRWHQARQQAEKNNPENRAAGANQPNNERNANRNENANGRNANAEENGGKAGASERNANRQENGNGRNANAEERNGKGKNARNAEENNGKAGANERNANREEGGNGKNANAEEQNGKGKNARNAEENGGKGAAERNANREQNGKGRNANAEEQGKGKNAKNAEEKTGKGAAERNATRSEQGKAGASERNAGREERGQPGASGRNANRAEQGRSGASERNANRGEQGRGGAAERNANREERGGGGAAERHRGGGAAGGDAAMGAEHRGAGGGAAEQRRGGERSGRAAAEGGRGGDHAGGAARKKEDQAQ